jgi:hypothetical protein
MSNHTLDFSRQQVFSCFMADSKMIKTFDTILAWRDYRTELAEKAGDVVIAVKAVYEGELEVDDKKSIYYLEYTLEDCLEAMRRHLEEYLDRCFESRYPGKFDFKS